MHIMLDSSQAAQHFFRNVREGRTTDIKKEKRSQASRRIKLGSPGLNATALPLAPPTLTTNN